MKWAAGGLIALSCLALLMPESWAGGDGARRRRGGNDRHRQGSRHSIKREYAGRIGFVFQVPEGQVESGPRSGSGGGTKPPDGKRGEGLECLEWLIGDWTAEEETKGQLVHYTLKNRWDEGRLLSHQTIRTGGTISSTFTLAYSWNPKEKRIEITGRGSRGGSVAGSMPADDERVDVDLAGHDRDMAKVEFALVLELRGEHTIEQTEPNEYTLVWSRKQAAP